MKVDRLPVKLGLLLVLFGSAAVSVVLGQRLCHASDPLELPGTSLAYVGGLGVLILSAAATVGAIGGRTTGTRLGAFMGGIIASIPNFAFLALHGVSPDAGLFTAITYIGSWLGGPGFVIPRLWAREMLFFDTHLTARAYTFQWLEFTVVNGGIWIITAVSATLLWKRLHAAWR